MLHISFQLLLDQVTHDFLLILSCLLILFDIRDFDALELQSKTDKFLWNVYFHNHDDLPDANMQPRHMFIVQVCIMLFKMFTSCEQNITLKRVLNQSHVENTIQQPAKKLNCIRKLHNFTTVQSLYSTVGNTWMNTFWVGILSLISYLLL